MKKQRGFILFTVLLFIQLVSLIELSVFESLTIFQLHFKFHHQQASETQKQHRLMVHLIQLIMQGYHPICEVSPQLNLRLKNEQWWHAYACQPSAAYQFILEHLGKDACMVCAQTAGGDFYRLTLRFQGSPVPELIQAILFLPKASSEHCDRKWHFVHCGLQFINYLT